MTPIPLDLLIARNRNWAMHSRRHDPLYFRRHQDNQMPRCLWIGCADSRVPAESLVQASPGELFVLRNVANQVLTDDDGMMSGVHYALTCLNIRMVIVCGHTGCGGVAYAGQQAVLPDDHGIAPPLQRQLAALRDFYREQLTHHSDWLSLPAGILQNTLAELNVRRQLSQLRRSALFQEISQTQTLSLHGCIYDLAQGTLNVLSDDTDGECA